MRTNLTETITHRWITIVKKSLFSAVVVLALMSLSVRAQDVVIPLTVTAGYNADLVAEGTNSAATTTSTGFDLYGTVFYDATYDASHGNHGGGLPAGTIIRDSSGIAYNLAPATGDNALLIGPGDSGALNVTYTNDAPLMSLSVLGTSADGGTILDYTLNFAGGATFSGSIVFNDWYDPRANGTFTSLGGVMQDDDFNSERGAMFSLTTASIEIPEEYAGLRLESITFAYDDGNVDDEGISPRAAVLGVTAFAPAVTGVPGGNSQPAPGLPASAPTLSSLTLTNQQIQFTVDGTTGSNYVVVAATSLAQPVWSPVLTNSAPFMYTESSLCPQRFYRAMVAP